MVLVARVGRLKRFRSFLLLILVLSGCSLVNDTVDMEDVTSSLQPVTYVRTVDGDTIVVDTETEDNVTVRLIGIDCPESVHPDESKNTPEGLDASEYTKSILDGQDLMMELGETPKDKYGRTLAYIYIGDEMVNLMILEAGHAEPMVFSDNDKYEDQIYDVYERGYKPCIML